MTAPFNAHMISVIMPCYNAAPFVQEAVQSALGQSYGEVELIVVDDGSTDESVEILEQLAKQHPGRLKLLLQNHLGPFPARNRGISEASGGLIAFLDADDYWSPDCLKKLSAALDQQRADIAYCGWQNVGDGPRGGAPYIPPDYSLMDMSVEFLHACPWPIHAALVRRPAMDAVAVREEFAAHYPERLKHIDERRRFELTSGVLLKGAYRAYWKRQLVDAHKLFRRALFKGHWKAGDLKYLLPALLPQSLFQTLIHTNDRLRDRKT